jgi:tripartite-type tricarboxylate transporter receptor subunit TctC
MLAVTSEQRNPRYPTVPTVRELGYANLSKDEWFGALLPAGTPGAILQSLHSAITRIAAMPDMVAALDRLEYLPTVSATPQAFAERIRREREEWGPIVQESGFKPEN